MLLVHQHRCNQIIGIDNVFRIVVETYPVKGNQAALGIVDTSPNPDFPPVDRGVLAFLVHTEQPRNGSITVAYPGRGQGAGFPACSIGIGLGGVRIFDGKDLLGRIFDRLLILKIFDDLKRVVLLFQERIFGMPATFEVAVHFFAIGQGNDHVIGVRIFFQTLGLSACCADGKQGCQKKDAFHGRLFNCSVVPFLRDDSRPRSK